VGLTESSRVVASYVRVHNARQQSFKLVDYIHTYTYKVKKSKAISVTGHEGLYGSVVVKALCYKPEGRGFKYR
jgi:hypothetical protein